MKKSTLLIVIAGLVVFSVGGYFLFQDRQGSELAAPSETSVADADEASGVFNDKKDGNVMELARSEGSLFGELEDVSGGVGSGTAYLYRQDGKLFHYVEASLPDPRSGSVYEGWLVNNSSSLKFFSTGVMEKEGQMYTLSYTTNDEFPGYNFVVITLETVVDATPEDHIIEGEVE